LRALRKVLVSAKLLVLVWGMDIFPSAECSLHAKFDRTFPIGAHVSARSYVAFEGRSRT
jgi:hypothetical protein